MNRVGCAETSVHFYSTIQISIVIAARSLFVKKITFCYLSKKEYHLKLLISNIPKFQS